MTLMLPVYLLIGLAIGGATQAADALGAWDKGCAAIGSYEVFVESQQKTLVGE
jgi:hypothetical protein